MCTTRTTRQAFSVVSENVTVRWCLWRPVDIAPPYPIPHSAYCHNLGFTNTTAKASLSIALLEVSWVPEQDRTTVWTRDKAKVTKSSALQVGDMECRNRVVRFRSRTHCGLMVTIFLIQIVGQTSPKAQYPVPGGQIPLYDDQYPDPGVDTARGGYQAEGNEGSRRQDSPVSRISGQDLRSLLQRVDVMLSNQCTRNVAAQWRFETDVNPATQQAAVSFCVSSLMYRVFKCWYIQSIISLLFEHLSVHSFIYYRCFLLIHLLISTSINWFIYLFVYLLPYLFSIECGRRVMLIRY
jgi:hypothetical protein